LFSSDLQTDLWDRQSAFWHSFEQYYETLVSSVAHPKRNSHRTRLTCTSLQEVQTRVAAFRHGDTLPSTTRSVFAQRAGLRNGDISVAVSVAEPFAVSVAVPFSVTDALSVFSVMLVAMSVAISIDSGGRL
jgi:hypothetical protein